MTSFYKERKRRVIKTVISLDIHMLLAVAAQIAV